MNTSHRSGVASRPACPTKSSVNGVVAFLTGIVSVYSSTSGVVLPAFLPMVPGLAATAYGEASGSVRAWACWPQPESRSTVITPIARVCMSFLPDPAVG